MDAVTLVKEAASGSGINVVRTYAKIVCVDYHMGFRIL